MVDYSDQIPLYPISEILKHIWRLNLITKIKLSAWKLVRDRISTKENLRKMVPKLMEAICFIPVI